MKSFAKYLLIAIAIPTIGAVIIAILFLIFGQESNCTATDRQPISEIKAAVKKYGLQEMTTAESDKLTELATSYAGMDMCGRYLNNQRMKDTASEIMSTANEFMRNYEKDVRKEFFDVFAASSGELKKRIKSRDIQYTGMYKACNHDLDEYIKKSYQ